ncbi:hypothetical protein J3E68DRAFT_416074 [Trichoderma sp. SZMC 28012]
MAGLAFALASSMAHLAAAFAWKGHGVKDKVSKQKDTKRANWGVGLAYPVHDVYYTGLTTKRALGLVIRSTSRDTESEYRRRILLRVWGTRHTIIVHSK